MRQSSSKYNITLILLVSIPLLLVGIPSGIYAMTLRGGASLGAVLIFFGVFVVTTLLVIDRFLAKKINPVKLSLFELAFIVISLLVYYYVTRMIIIDIETTDYDYFVLIENSGQFKNSDLTYSFPFDQKIQTEGQHSVINSIHDNFHKLQLEWPEKWTAMTMKPRLVRNYKVQFYNNGKMKFTDEQIDSLVIYEINSGM